MYKLVFVGSVAAFVNAHNGHGHPVHHGIVSDIKQKTTSWKPIEVEENPLKNYSADTVRGLLGTRVRGPQGYPAPAVSNVEAPTNFDART